MTQAGELWRLTAEKVMKPLRGVSTAAGSTTTLKDDSIVNAPVDDTYNDGTIFFVSGPNAGKACVITDYDQDDGTGDSVFTFTPAVTSTVSGEVYWVFPKKVSLDSIIAGVNAAISELPWIDKVDDTTTTVADQEAYDLPSDCVEVREILEAQSTSTPYDWKPNPFYRIRYNHTTSKYQLVFNPNHQPATADYLIRVVYKYYPVSMDDYDDELSDWYNTEWVSHLAAKHIKSWHMKGQEGQSGFDVSSFQESAASAEILRKKYINRIPRTQKQATYGAWAGV
jgi:hypothetical protein